MTIRFKTIVGVIRLLLLSLWLGAAVFFSAVVAPAVFGVLRSFNLPNANEIAGTIVTRSLATVNAGGFAISVLLLVAALVVKRAEKRALFLTEVISLAIMGIITGLSQWVISARMVALRVAMSIPIDQIARADPRRVEFDSLHGYSVAALGIAILAGLVAFIALSQRPGLTKEI